MFLLPMTGQNRYDRLFWKMSNTHSEKNGAFLIWRVGSWTWKWGILQVVFVSYIRAFRAPLCKPVFWNVASTFLPRGRSNDVSKARRFPAWTQSMRLPWRDDGRLVPFWPPSVTRGGGLKVPFFQKNWISNFCYLIQRGTFRPPSSEMDKKWGWKKGVSFRVDFPLFGGFILSRSKEARYKKTTYRIFSENSRQKIAKAILEKRSKECHTGRWIWGRRAKSERKARPQAMQAPGRDDGWLVPFWHPSVTRGGGLKVPFFQKKLNFKFLLFDSKRDF